MILVDSFQVPIRIAAISIGMSMVMCSAGYLPSKKSNIIDYWRIASLLFCTYGGLAIIVFGILFGYSTYSMIAKRVSLSLAIVLVAPPAFAGVIQMIMWWMSKAPI